MNISASALLVAGLIAVATPGLGDVLKGRALAAAVSGKELRFVPPSGEGFDGVTFIAQLLPNGVARLSAESDGKRIDVFTDTQRWRVRGQGLCIFDGSAPMKSDCIRVDDISGNRIRLTRTLEDGSRRRASGTLSPL